VPFEQGVRDTVAWYAANRRWWEPLRDRAPVVETAWGSGTAGTTGGATSGTTGAPGRRPGTP
jgi:hypothetical protein